MVMLIIRLNGNGQVFINSNGWAIMKIFGGKMNLSILQRWELWKSKIYGINAGPQARPTNLPSENRVIMWRDL